MAKGHKPPMEGTVLLTTVYSRVESDMIRELLQNAGIPTLIRPKYGFDPLPVLAGSTVMGEEIYVIEEKLESAKDLLTGFVNGDYEELPETVPEEDDK